MAEPVHGSRSRMIWIGVAIVFSLLVGITEVARRYQEFQASICTVHNGVGFWHSSESFNYMQTTFFKDQQRRPVAYILSVYDDFDPNLPTLRYSYHYDQWRGGILEVDGVPLRRSTAATLFVSGPYGATVKIDLTQAEAIDLFGRTETKQLREFWNDFVEPRIYKVHGEKVSSQREGTWTFDLPTGERYLEANFTNGKRDGAWTVYYPNGNIQTRKQFQNGQAIGEWEYFDESGQSLGTLEFVRGHLKDIATEQGAGGTGVFSSKVVTDKAGRASGITFTANDGGVFLLLGQRFPRFRWSPTPAAGM